LVELLVVIGIIAVLISLLLTALGAARRQAQQVQCASNMRQIAMAVLSYTVSNKGVLPPCLISSDNADPTNPYPDGWFWAAELVQQKYIDAPNVWADTGRSYGGRSVFECPSGRSAEDANPGAGTSNVTIGTRPTDPINMGGSYGAANNPRFDGQPAYGVTTWYQLCAVNTGSTKAFADGSVNAPFVYYNENKNGVCAGYGGTVPPGMGGQLSLPYVRKISRIKRTDILCMIAEAASINWLMSGSGFNPSSSTVNGETMWMQAIAARHGKVMGNNALTNMAFFDGHVSLLPTQPIEDYVDPVSGKGGAPNIPESVGVVFTMSKAR
jgi:prepilin-type processing-associated H-X9-DG protein